MLLLSLQDLGGSGSAPCSQTLPCNFRRHGRDTDLCQIHPSLLLAVLMLLCCSPQGLCRADTPGEVGKSSGKVVERTGAVWIPLHRSQSSLYPALFNSGQFAQPLISREISITSSSHFCCTSST